MGCVRVLEGREGLGGRVNVRVLLIWMLSSVSSSIIHSRKEEENDYDERRKLRWSSVAILILCFLANFFFAFIDYFLKLQGMYFRSPMSEFTSRWLYGRE